MTPLQAWLPSMVCAVALLGAAASPEDPQPRPAAKGWMDRHQEKLSEIRKGDVTLIMLGDSITAELESERPDWGNISAVWRRYYACRKAVNLGFAGDTTSNLLWRIENGEVAGIAPRIAVVMIGTNNIRPKIESTSSGTVQGIEAVVEELHRRLPTTRILLLGIPPSARAPEVEAERAQINSVLAARDWRPLNTMFQSVDAALSQNGDVDPSLFRAASGHAAVHPNEAGWDRIAKTIEPTIARLSGMPPCTSS